MDESTRMNQHDIDPFQDNISMNEMILDLCSINGNDGIDLGNTANSSSDLTQHSDQAKTKKRRRKVTDNSKVEGDSRQIVSIQAISSTVVLDDSKLRFATIDTNMTERRQQCPTKIDSNPFVEKNAIATNEITPAFNSGHPRQSYPSSVSQFTTAKRKKSNLMPVSDNTSTSLTNSPEVDFSSCVYKILTMMSSKECRPGFSFDDSRSVKDTELAIAELSYLCKAKLYHDQHHIVGTSDAQVTSFSPDSGKLKQPNHKSPKVRNIHQRIRNSQRIQLDIEINALISLVDILTKHVQAALGVHIIEDAMKVIKSLPPATISRSDSLEQWLSNGVGSDLLVIIRMGLESASIIFFLALCKVPSSNNVSCVNDDAMEASIALFRAYLIKTVIPAINQTGHLVDYSSNESTAGSPVRSTKRHSPMKAVDESSTTESTKVGTHDVKKETSKTYASLFQEMNKVYRMIIERTTPLLLLLSERIQIISQHIALDDQQVLLITNGAIATMEIECSDGSTGPIRRWRGEQFSLTSKDYTNSLAFSLQLQLSGISLLASMFQRYSNHREVILEDIFPLMLKIPTQKRSMRSFAIEYTLGQASNKVEDFNTQLTLLPPPHAIQMMTALILSLVQCCVMFPMNGNKSRSSLLETGSQSCWNVADSLVKQLLQRCSIGKGDMASGFRPFLVRFVEDLLSVWILPEYPAAEILLLSIIRRLTLEIDIATKNKGSQQASIVQETTYINLAFDILAKVSVVQARLQAMNRKFPIPIISTRASRPAESAVVSRTCDYDQGGNDLMISCDSCYSFVKASSVGILNADCIPDEWNCDSCRLGSISLREQRKYDINLIDDRYVLQHAFATCLTQSNGASELENAIRLHLALWIEDIDVSHAGDSKLKLIRDLSRYFNSPRPSGPFGESLSSDGYARLLLARKANSSSMQRSFRPLISFFIRIMSDECGAANGTNGLRKVSLKVIERICEADPDLMTSGIIIKAVSSRLTDDSISVREAALSLVGSFVIHTPTVANAFHASLLGCLRDVGVSVRKRGVKIFQSILISNDGYEGRSEVYDSLFKTATDPKEEDVVRDLVHELFYHLWLTNSAELLPDSSHLTQRICEEANFESSLQPLNCVTPPATSGEAVVKGNKRRLLRADLAVSQMIDVVRIGETGDHLCAMLSELLESDERQDVEIDQGSDILGINSPGRRRSFTTAATLVASKRKSKFRLSEEHQQECTALLVSAVFEALVSLEERRSIKPEDQDGKNLAAALQTIEVFAKLAPSRIFPHVDTLLPYLKADNGVPLDDEAVIVGAVCDILFRLVSPLSLVRDQVGIDKRFNYVDPLAFSSAIANDLVQISYKFGASALNSAVRVLVVLANLHFSDESNPCVKACLSLARTFYSYLYKKASIPDLSNSDFQIQSGVQRGLTVLGLICQYHENALSSEVWEREVDRNDVPMPPKQFDWLSINLACYRLFSKYLHNADPQTQCRAMQALGGLFLAQPRLVLQLERIGLIADVMSEKAVLLLQLEALECWMKILISEEERIDGGAADAKMDAQGNITVPKKISGDQDGDATLFGGVLTNHTKRLFEMLHSKQPQLRFSSLELISLLLRQGLVNPNEAVPHLFALQGDIENSPIRSLALTLLMIEGERRPDILRQRVCAGVKLAYEMQRNLYHGKRSVTAIINVKRAGRQSPEIECVFSSIFKECIIHNRKLRHGLYRNLLGLFETDDGSNEESIVAGGRQLFLGTKVDYQTKDINLLSYVAQVLAHLPYNVVNDPLFIVHRIGSIITLQGQQCLERFNSFLLPFGLARDDDLDETNLSEDALERAAASKFPSRTHGASVLNSKDFDLLEFYNICQESASLCLLLRLKSFLCTSYQLSLTRCLEYDPNAKERISDKGALRGNVTKEFDGSIVDTLIYNAEDVKSRPLESKKFDKDGLVKQYAEFRVRMREEHSLVPDDNSCDKSEGDGEEFTEVEETNPGNDDDEVDVVDESIEVPVVKRRRTHSAKTAKEIKPTKKGRGRRSTS